MALPKTVSLAILAAAAILLVPDSARAGWLSIVNDTNRVLVVQESPGPLGIFKRGRTVRLMPGEVYREFQIVPGQKEFAVYDSCCPAKPIFKGDVAWKLDDVRASLKDDGTAVRLTSGTAAEAAPTARR